MHNELLGLVTSNFYSILYYNSEIWHLPTLNVALKQKLLSASAKALKVCCKMTDFMVSFASIHRLCNRATPVQMMKYKLALCLFKMYNRDFNPVEFVTMNFNQIFTSRQSTFKILKNNRRKVGINSLANRFHLINDIIPFTWLNLSMESFKLKCKKLLL